MSKPKPPHTPASRPADPSAPGSSATAVLREIVRTRLELIGRMEYRELQSLKAQLAELPPVPEPQPAEPPVSPSNDV
jgi:hypothetical protein